MLATCKQIDTQLLQKINMLFLSNLLFKTTKLYNTEKVTRDK